jgi:hypothetical protein
VVAGIALAVPRAERPEEDWEAERAAVPTTDLEAPPTTWGLVATLETFHAEQRGRDVDDQLPEQLQAMHRFGMNREPLRHQTGVGTGWEFLARNITDLRELLVKRYGEAAGPAKPRLV